MPINSRFLLPMLAAVLQALVVLPPEYDHQPLAATAVELLKTYTGHSPPQPD